MCLVNAFVIYKHKHPTFAHYDFMFLVHEGLLTSVFASGVPRQISTRQGSSTTHTLVAKEQGKQRQCVVCGSGRGHNHTKRKRTKFYCPTCSVHICPVPCNSMWDHEKHEKRRVISL